ncbi:MAG: hypothetical protein CVT62_01940 [Actinobacteria bacterium HGW-Actinobacteria-2]|nr:MAG: hypothetical protein CVT62_01940 [Actinobacteria bacterium HGW-Actinobacteria-2]
MSLVFVPLTPLLLRDWASGASMPASLPAYTDTPALRSAFDITDEEDAERVALLAASVAGLAAYGLRLVAVAEAAPVPRPNADPDFGEVNVAVGSYGTVSALFVDEAGVADAAAAAASGLPLAEAWEDPAVIGLLSDADLLWHGPGEWEALISG